MSPRVTIWTAPRAGLEELVGMTVRELADRLQATVHVNEYDDVYLAPSSADAQWGVSLAPEHGSAQLLATRVGELCATSSGFAWDFLRGLVGAPWPGVREAIGGYRRWWLSGLAHTIEQHGMRDALRRDLEALVPLITRHPCWLEWLDALAVETAARRKVSGPVLRSPLPSETTLLEIEPDDIAPLLEWSSKVEHWLAPGDCLGAPGDDEFDHFVRRHLDALASARPGELIVAHLS